MQCTSYNPVSYHAGDLKVGASGFGWHLYDSNASYGEERGYNNSMPLCEQYKGYDKEVVKQTIQNHEATFRYQVQELHRLHKRQRDLMEEMRMREIFAQHLIQASSRGGDESLQEPSPATDWLLGNLSSRRHAQGLRSFVAENSHKATTLHNDSFMRRNVLYDAKFLSSSSMRDGNRFADLEFAAGTCRDNQVKQFKAENLSEATELTYCAPEKVSNFHPTSDSNIGSVKTWDVSSSSSNNWGKSCFIDLNEPVQFESLPPRLSVCSNQRVPVEATPESIVPTHSQLMKNGESSSDCVNSLMAIDLNSMPVNYFSETEMTLESLPSMNKKCSEDEEAIVQKDTDDSFLKTESFIDLNTRVEDEHSLPPSSSTVEMTPAEYRELKGPVSPENEERCPSRGKSEDTQLETPLSSEQGEGEPFIELETTAAQTLVMILSSGLEGANFRNLCWFSEIVSSNGDELENALNSTPFNKSKGAGNMPRMSVKGSKRVKKQRKNFKTNLTRDDHVVEGFFETGPLNKNASVKPRKCSKLSPSDVKESAAASSDCSVVQSWGKTRKREGGRRRRASESFVMS